MSFADYMSKPATAGSQQDGALNRLFADFSSQINHLKRKSELLGSKRDSQDLRYSIETEVIPHCETLRDEIESSLKHKGSNGKLASDFAGLKDELLLSRRQYYGNKSRHPIQVRPVRTNSASRDSGYVSMPVAESTDTTPLLQGQNHQHGQRQLQQQVQSQNRLPEEELNFHTLIQQERSEEIGRIHSAVQEVNAIFHQLGSLVREQGEDVDTIDNNISGLSGNLQRANEQLGKAERSQRKRNRCGIIFLVVIVVVVLIVILAVLG
ncbi:LAFA_0C06502g1_1 [Lachancea sp. 'fantastica']|nr:LAFA_0C06502g1_1 [Lachancea sp. 'fantastica']